jgi:putative ABC transport system permease protein
VVDRKTVLYASHALSGRATQSTNLFLRELSTIVTYLKLIFRNVGRNPLRSLLTAMVTMVLVFVVTIVWSVLFTLSMLTTEKSQNFRAMVMERWSIPSRLPYAYADALSRGAARNPDDVRPTDWMSWQFYVGTLDPAKLTRENIVFCMACDADKIATMLEGMDNLPASDDAQLRKDIVKLKAKREGVIVGHNHLAATNKRIGERFKLTGAAEFRGIDLEFEIVGVFPVGRYDSLAAINREYFNNAFDAYATRHHGRKHPRGERNLSIMWLKVPDTAAFNRIAAQIESSPEFSTPAVKCETAASGISSFLEALRDLIWGVRYLLAPACLTTILLVIANAISINVRERRLELAVMKVLGFRPLQILVLVLGESLMLGVSAGFISSGLTYAVINHGMGGLHFQLAFLDTFMIPKAALWWGPAVGGMAALCGSFFPAWSARNVKVADVFSKVA